MEQNGLCVREAALWQDGKSHTADTPDLVGSGDKAIPHLLKLFADATDDGSLLLDSKLTSGKRIILRRSQGELWLIFPETY